MTKATTEGSLWKQWAAAMLCLAVVLGFLFRESFESDKVLFSNDAPLGLISSKAAVSASTFEGIVSGFWQDLNWIGIEMPSVLPGLSWAFFQLFGSSAALNAKFHVPVSFLFLGFSAWLLFRTLGFRPVVCVIGALAAALNMNSFSHGTWGLPSRALTGAAALLAIAALYSGLRGRPWIKAALAGMCVGLGIVEGFDVGALYSLYIAAFGVFLAFTKSHSREYAKGVAMVGVVALFAALFSAQALSTLIGTQVKGVAGMQQDEKTRNDRWVEATAWSLPKAETLRVIIPGLFGYRMDTPEGGAYWGMVGHREDLMRHSGAGEYAGILVVLAGIFGVANAFRKQSLYSDLERRVVRFWSVAAIVSVLFAWGHWAPFYQILYKLPFFSTIRNPIKFMHFFHLSLLILFGYGLNLIFRHYISAAGAKAAAPMEQFKTWWSKAAAFDRRVVLALGAGLVVSLLGFLIYSSAKGEVTKYLEMVGFPAPASGQIVSHSLSEVGEYLFFYVIALAALLLALSGFFNGTRARWAGLVIGAVLVFDLARANKPWIVYYNYKERYVSNGVLDFLRQNVGEQRVTMRVAPFTSAVLLSPQFDYMQAVFSEWLQNHFPYFNIPSLDIIQMSRVPELDAQYRDELLPKQVDLYKCARLWQLSSTRYILGQKDYLQELNQRFDPQFRRFQIATNFDLVPKPGVAPNPAGMSLADVTFELSPNGPLSIFEFTGALPRYRLYSRWDKAANDSASLATLAKPDFDPFQQLIVNDPDIQSASSSTNAPDGAAQLVKYEPKRIELKTEASAPSILLWNDRWSPNWKAFVDGQEVKLLRCNFIMRGVPVPAGAHQVEMRYAQPARALWISFATLVAGIAMCLFLAVESRRKKS